MKVIYDIFYLKDVVEIVGVRRPTLQQWLRDGYIRASVPGEGSGSRNMFTFDDVCKIKTFKILVEYGYTRKLASKVVKSSESHGE